MPRQDSFRSFRHLQRYADYRACFRSHSIRERRRKIKTQLRIIITFRSLKAPTCSIDQRTRVALVSVVTASVREQGQRYRAAQMRARVGRIRGYAYARVRVDFLPRRAPSPRSLAAQGAYTRRTCCVGCRLGQAQGRLVHCRLALPQRRDPGLCSALRPLQGPAPQVRFQGSLLARGRPVLQRPAGQ